jgi:MFS family permease
MAVIPEHGMALPFVGVQEPWRVVFILFGAIGLVFALAVLTFREPPRRERLKSKTADSTALKYIWERRKFYLWFLGGAAMIYAMNYGLGAWMPAFFMRTYGLSVTQMGYLAAPMILVPQIVGLLATGAIADKFFSKGRTDIHLILLIVLASLKAIFVAVAMSAGLGLVPTAILVGCATLCSGATGVAPAVLQLVTPNQYRGQTASAYLLATSLVGLGLGPLITGFLTTFVFQDPAKVGWSIAVSFVLLQPLAVLALTRALPEVRKAASEAEGWK